MRILVFPSPANWIRGTTRVSKTRASVFRVLHGIVPLYVGIRDRRFDARSLSNDYHLNGRPASTCLCEAQLQIADAIYARHYTRAQRPLAIYRFFIFSPARRYYPLRTLPILKARALFIWRLPEPAACADRYGVS